MKTKATRRLSLPVWALLGSVALHLLLLWPVSRYWHPMSWFGGKQERLIVKVMRSPNQSSQPSLVSPAQVGANTPKPPVTHPPPDSLAADPQQRAGSEAPQDTDDGYLPSEFLSVPATPVQEIDLQTIDPPEATGRLQLLLWINHQGEVVKVDVEVTEAPGRFTDQVAERFKQAHFVPGQRNGKAVASLMRIEVAF